MEHDLRLGDYEYDLVVIGGGSGGLACAKEAALLGAKVVLFDFVSPSTQGSTWGLGGTCVNVGCVPKKIMHAAGLMSHTIFHDGSALGWKLSKGNYHNWETLIETVRNHVGMLNFRYRVGLRNGNVEYINAFASLEDAHTVIFSYSSDPTSIRRITTSSIVICTGCRPIIPSDVPGALEYAISSDDIFNLRKPPGKTLCVGGSYVALECAGFLTEVGYDVTVAVRSIALRNFDRQCADKVVDLMTNLGTTFAFGYVPTSISKAANGQFSVVLANENGDEKVDLFDTVFYAIGRKPDIKGMNLHNAGVEIHSDGKIAVDENDATSSPTIYAIGDVAFGRPELTPVAIKAGEMLAQRLFNLSVKLMDYRNIPTCVFTPFEFASMGLTEEDALMIYGDNDVDIFLSEFSTLEISAVHRVKHRNMGDDVDFGPNCLAKLVCVKSLNNRVVGIHFVGPNAGEVIQGFALAIKLGVTKADFDDLVGIHPTDAECFCNLKISKRSKLPFTSEPGCGGGVCG